MPNLPAVDSCTGCAACFSICPRRAIRMGVSDKGFDAPVVADSCVECGLCEKICPINVEILPSSCEEQEAYAGISLDEETWKSSSSGGAFTCLVESFLEMVPEGCNCIVFGAAFEHLNVKHIGVVSDDISPLRKSKYVQSSIGESYLKAKKALGDGSAVVFSGTPCQIAGLRSYLGKEYELLLCIDFVCHGVGSPRVFQDCMNKEGTTRGKLVTGYSFREKRNRFGNFSRYVSKYTYEDGSERLAEMDYYNRLFLSQLCLRDCCGDNCAFRSQHRLGDVTLADLNGKNQIFPDLNDSRPYSCFVVNTEKGRRVCSLLGSRMNLLPMDIEDVKKYNPLFCRTLPENPARYDFFEEYIAGVAVDGLVEKYAPKRFSIKNWLVANLPWRLKRFLRQRNG